MACAHVQERGCKSVHPRTARARGAWHPGGRGPGRRGRRWPAGSIASAAPRPRSQRSPPHPPLAPCSPSDHGFLTDADCTLTCTSAGADHRNLSHHITKVAQLHCYTQEDSLSTCADCNVIMLRSGPCKVRSASRYREEVCAGASPLKGRPARPTDMIMERETRRWSQSAVLSPVQMGPTVWLPAKKARLSTKGRSPSLPYTALPRSSSPCNPALLSYGVSVM